MGQIMGVRNRFKPQGYFPIYILSVRFVADYVGGVQIPVTRSNRKGAVSASFFFFPPFSRTLAPLRHTMVVETEARLPTSYLFRRFAMNNCLCNVFDNNNWIWIVLIVLLFSCCCGGC